MLFRQVHLAQKTLILLFLCINFRDLFLKTSKFNADLMHILTGDGVTVCNTIGGHFLSTSFRVSCSKQTHLLHGTSSWQIFFFTALFAVHLHI